MLCLPAAGAAICTLHGCLHHFPALCASSSHALSKTALSIIQLPLSQQSQVLCLLRHTIWLATGKSHQKKPVPTPAAPCVLQDEVGVRLTQADPGAADWRVMNLLTQYHSRAQYL